MKKGIKLSIPVLIVILALLLSSGFFVTTHQNEYTIVRQFGAVVKIVDEPGLSVKIPFIQSTSTLPKTEMLYDLAVSDVITSDKKSMVADSFVLWRISDPLKFIQTLSGNIGNAEYRIDTVVYNSLKTVISSMRQEEVISGRDGLLAQRIMDNVGSTFERYGIDLLAIETKRIDLPDENKSAVYERMISEREKIAAGFTAKGAYDAKITRNEADKQVGIIQSEGEAKATVTRAEGDAEYMRILAEAYDTPEKAEFYEFMISLDAAKKSLSGGNKTLILDEDSPLASLFYQKSGSVGSPAPVETEAP